MPDLSPPAPVGGPIAATVFLNFLCYFAIGIPLAVLPGHVLGLGYGPVIAGLTISIQYVATFLSRPHAGRISDTVGPKHITQWGLIGCTLSGLVLLASGFLSSLPILALAVLLASRLLLGFAESWVATGAITWAIGRTAPEHTAQVVSWNGIATYGGLALGAPLGVAINQTLGFSALGISMFALGLFGSVLAWKYPRVSVIAGDRLPFGNVFMRVLPCGMGLALGAVGFGALATFVTLFYASKGWSHPAWALSMFGFTFIATRLIFANAINRHGGFRVAIISTSVESLGLLMVWLAPAPLLSLLGAGLTGIGFALVFPALAVEAVRLVTPANRGAALGLYSVFVDVSLGITGPVVGLFVNGFGYPSVFLVAAIAALASTLLSITLYRQTKRGRHHPAGSS
ncbi:MAG: MFS transporter [Parvibaculaceae bacterium]|nr:MFS transporter [Parvibaculaceae bacterium]